MTNAITFDTHRFVKQMTDAGFTTAQAEALSDEQANLITTNLATKHDIEELKQATKHDIAQLKTDLEKTIKVTIEETKSSLIKWTVIVMGIYSVIIIGILH